MALLLANRARGVARAWSPVCAAARCSSTLQAPAPARIPQWLAGLPLDKPILVTTPIFYVNAAPHIGHLYSALLADAINRCYRMLGASTVFSTGTDEHGMKIQDEAAKKGVSPAELCRANSLQYMKLFDACHIQYTDFVRTTEPRHKEVVAALWSKLEATGNIYMGRYEGWYSVPDETFVPSSLIGDGVRKADGTTPCKVSLESGHELTWVTEQNYMFRLSNWAAPLRRWLEERPGAVYPRVRHEQTLQYLSDREQIDDLSVSRPSSRLQWGIPVPGNDKHVIYVWLDALANYLTVSRANAPHPTASALGPPPCTLSPDLAFPAWPANIHVIGKDILKFHAVFWPAFLLAADLPLPLRIVAHGHWTMEKQKMSKSKGNVVDPFSRIQLYGVDPFRYFLLKEGGLASDGDYSDERVIALLNGDLCDALGNLLSRMLSESLLSAANLRLDTGAWESCAPSPFAVPRPADAVLESAEARTAYLAGTFGDAGKELSLAVEETLERVWRSFLDMEFGRGIGHVNALLQVANRFVSHTEPWKLSSRLNKAAKARQTPIPPELVRDSELLRSNVFVVLETLRRCALCLLPIMPSSMSKLLDEIGVPATERQAAHLFTAPLQPHTLLPTRGSGVKLFQKHLVKN